MLTKDAIREVRSAKWFGNLSEDDLKARYPVIRKRLIVDSVIKFARKNLVIKSEVLGVGDGIPLGTWKITEKGLARARDEIGGWTARYRHHEAVIIEYEEKS